MLDAHTRIPVRRSRDFPPLLLLAIACLFLGTSTAFTHAEDKKPDPAKVVPHIMMAMPPAITRGSTSTVIFRGKGLADATEVHADTNGSAVHMEIKSKGKADLPKPELAEKMGDTQVEVELEVPIDAEGDEVTVTVIAPNGTSESHVIRLYNAADLLTEKEPNGGFRTAQEIDPPITIVGSIGRENDVDVFRITGKAGQKISAEVTAARVGSALDSLLTIYDEHGRVVAVNDDADAGSADSLLNVSLPHDGIFYISLTDAQGNGGAMYPYLLRIAVD